jgi:2-methylcitrate dehydratase PrpD
MIGLDEHRMVHDTNHTYIPECITCAQFWISLGVAVNVLEGDAFVGQHTEEKIRSPRIIALANKVEVLNDIELDKLAPMHRHHTRTQLTLKDGEVLEETVAHRRGGTMPP